MYTLGFLQLWGEFSCDSGASDCTVQWAQTSWCLQKTLNGCPSIWVDCPMRKCGRDGLCSALSAYTGNLMNEIQPSIFRMISWSWFVPICPVNLTEKVPVLRFQSKAIKRYKNCLVSTIFHILRKTWNTEWLRCPFESDRLLLSPQNFPLLTHNFLTFIVVIDYWELQSKSLYQYYKHFYFFY